ncbi:potassium-transporting ATPase subunit KdpB [Nocardiopsis changdeensis]|uniref:Potassium-transporting ATPase ATP-binding subunit n=1 Tax=Nocardiopsis changdeensis TaxID=2831969 RepID=A0ABX8BI38_9ACTN|nr:MULTISPECIES: potassium-transporting ATPase subunit KdpB [Nocardiopsis]QUX20503.1 potassium-transporting ATPase subunit KdpB [Nocardiopsis changdeensis]QYX36434.1 potassium-transporting ATPase subunit KdpB [Nocardiopsis sp. MT53]
MHDDTSEPVPRDVITAPEREPVFIYPPDEEAFPEPKGSLVSGPILRQALIGSVRKLDPRVQFRNPVMFVVLVGSALATVLFTASLVQGDTARAGFGALLTVFLWATLLFANFAEALAEGRGKAQAAALRATRRDTEARVRTPGGELVTVAGTDLKVGDECVVAAGQVIPGDGDVVEGIATVDESAITGESAPVIRESGGDRSAVTGGTTVLSDEIVVRITTPPGETFLDRMIALVEGAERKKTPNEIALNILLGGLTIVFLVAVVTLQPLAVYSQARQDTIVLIALLVCLIPTTIGALLSAIGIAGMDRLVRRNVMATSGRAVEASGDVTTLLLDKTGTITHGNRQASEFLTLPGVSDGELAEAAHRSSLSDGTPEGRSIVDFAMAGRPYLNGRTADRGVMVPFTAESRMSGLDDGAHLIRKGAVDAVARWVRENGGEAPDRLFSLAEKISDQGGTPLAVAEVPEGGGPARALGLVHLKDTVKPGMRERFEQLRTMGIRTVMVTGDNPRTAAVIAKEAGVDDFLAQAAPEDKLALIRREQAGGALVAMTGDGTNDAPALAQADVGVAMNTGTQAAREAGNMVDLDSDPTKLIEIVHIGKQLLITRGALTTFSIANDVAKYFAILPAMFAASLPGLERMNIMGLASAESAILSAVVFNALVIVALVPLALRGVAFRARSASAMLRRNLLVYGVGGLIAPFVGIKLIDMLISALGVL